MSTSGRPRFTLVIALVGAIGAALAVVAFAALRSLAATTTVGLGQPIRQDDFTYRVVGVAKAQEVGMGPDAVRASGVYYVVTVQIDNEAKVVSFQWDPSMVRVIDAAQRRYDFSVDAQRTLDASSSATTVVGAGESRRFLVAFDLPKGVDRPELAFSNGILMGDVFDFAAYSRARVPLE